MDTCMPVMDGLECTRRIRELPRHRYTPVVALTANRDSEEECMLAGMTRFMSKPLSMQDWRTIAAIAGAAPSTEDAL